MKAAIPMPDSWLPSLVSVSATAAATYILLVNWLIAKERGLELEFGVWFMLGAMEMERQLYFACSH
jgi:hypothetical protein